jgi:hypothetical protein
LGVGEGVHFQPGNGDTDMGLRGARRQGTLTPALSRREREIGREGKRPHTNAGEDAVLAAAELCKHGAGARFVARFAEDEAVAFGNRIGGDDYCWGLGAGGLG